MDPVLNYAEKTYTKLPLTARTNIPTVLTPVTRVKTLISLNVP